MTEIVEVRYIDLNALPRGGLIEAISAPPPARKPPSDPRTALVAAASRNGMSLAHLSLTIGRNAAYLQQFVKSGSPKRLPEQERRHLAIYMGIDERELGAREPWRPGDPTA